MTRPRVLMLVKNDHPPDPRVHNEARVLAERYDVTVWAIDTEGVRPRFEERDGYRIERLHQPLAAKLRPRPGAPREALGTARDRVGVAVERAHVLARAAGAAGRGFRVVHCHDLNTLPYGLLLGRLARARVVFDAHEDYPGSVRFHRGVAAARTLARIERFLAARVDAVIVVGERMREAYRGRTDRPVHLIGNWKDRSDYAPNPALVDERVHVARRAGRLVVAYLSGIVPNRVLAPLVEAVARRPRERLLAVAGVRDHTPLGREVASLLAAAPNAVNLGWLGTQALAAHFAAADAVAYLLRGEDPNTAFSTPNTLFAALASGTPLVTTPVGEIAAVVERAGCGLVAPPEADALDGALEQLADPTTRARMAEAARSAYSEFSWERFRSALFELYGGLLETR